MLMNMAEIITSGLKLFSLSSCSSFQNFSSQKYFLNFKIHKKENYKKNRKKISKNKYTYLIYSILVIRIFYILAFLLNFLKKSKVRLE